MSLIVVTDESSVTATVILQPSRYRDRVSVVIIIKFLLYSTLFDRRNLID